MEMVTKGKRSMNERTSRKLCVVLADDEPIMLMNLSEVLESNGYDVVGTAVDGFEAIDVCKTQHPDIVLLDIQMPVLDGLAAAKYIRAEHLAKTIIIISAFSDDDFVVKAGTYGVSGYLVKPIDTHTLLSTMKVAVIRSEELQDLRDEINKVTRDMETRKKVERAKGILMQTRNMGEQEAYDTIRMISKERNMSMELVAEILLCGSDKE